MTEFLFGVGLALVVVCSLWIGLRARRGASAKEVRIFSSIEQLRAIGQLSVYKVMTKEIVTKRTTPGASSAPAIWAGF